MIREILYSWYRKRESRKGYPDRVPEVRSHVRPSAPQCSLCEFIHQPNIQTLDPSTPCILSLFNLFSVIIRQRCHDIDTQDHHQQPNRHDNKQREPKPAQHHRRRAHPRPHRPIPHVLRDGRSRDRGRVLPQHADEHEDRGHEDERERDLADGSGGEGLDVALGAAFVGFLVPAGEGGEQEEADEGEDDGNDAVGVRAGLATCAFLFSITRRLAGKGEMGRWGEGSLHQVREDDTVFEGVGHPDQIQRILIHAHLAGQTGRVVGAQKGAAVRVDADAEVADADLQFGAADDVGDGGGDARVDLGGVEGGRVGLVVERDEEDVGDEGRGGGTAGEEECWWKKRAVLAGIFFGRAERRGAAGLQSRIMAMAMRIMRTWW